MYMHELLLACTRIDIIILSSLLDLDSWQWVTTAPDERAIARALSGPASRIHLGTNTLTDV